MKRPRRSCQPPASRKASVVPRMSTFFTSISARMSTASVCATGEMATGSLVPRRSAR